MSKAKDEEDDDEKVDKADDKGEDEEEDDDDVVEEPDDEESDDDEGANVARNDGLVASVTRRAEEPSNWAATSATEGARARDRR